MEKILQKMGLFPKEIAIYLAALQWGSRPASILAAKAGINRATAYNIIDALVEKGFLHQSVIAGVKHFSPLSPQELPHKLEQQKEALENIKSEVVGMMDELEKLQNKNQYKKPRLKFFEGVSGIKEVLEDIVTAQDKNLYAWLSLMDIYELVGEEYFAAYTRRRIQKGFTLHVIRSEQQETGHYLWRTSTKEKRLLRYSPKGILTPMSLYLYDKNKVAFFASTAENFSLVVESVDFYNTQKAFYDTLWASSTPVRSVKKS
jgi:sugar-specific transcriptional regulator TrmB